MRKPVVIPDLIDTLQAALIVRSRGSSTIA
jgi:hypothetical protein